MAMSKRDFLKISGLACCGILSGLTPSHALDLEKSFFTEEEITRFMTEARYYIQTPKGIKCQLCPNDCILKEGELGDCRTRIAVGNKLFSTAYGNPAAIHTDPIEKKPLYHFLPGTKAYSIATAGCNLACLNCQNWELSQSDPRKVAHYDMMPEQVVANAISSNCSSIAYTYSEPIVFYEYVAETAKVAHQENIMNVIVSAGYIHEKPLRNWLGTIDAANIDLKSFSNEIYEMLNAGTLDPVLNTLKILRDEGVWLEITNLIVPQWTDDLDMIKEMCAWLTNNGFESTPLHFSRFSPKYQLVHLPPTPVDVLTEARDIAHSEGLKHVYIGNVPGLDAENTYCPNCHHTIIHRKGFQILDNKIQGGKCHFCETKINGVW